MGGLTTSDASDAVDSRLPNSETSELGQEVWTGKAIPLMANKL
ncbi:MAG: hypothetical protein AAGB04_10010 [Pseudomonadota bacterium]